MDHDYIAEHSLIERYHRGLLAPEEEARFEEHFFGCPECTAQIELARSFGRGMRVMAALAAEDAARGAVAVGLFAWLARRGRFAQAGLALAALLAAAAIPALWFAVREEKAAGAVAAYRQQLESERRKAADLGHRLESEAGRGGERRQLEARLEAAQKAPRAAPLNEVLFNTPVLLLHTFRDEPGSAPAVIDLKKAAGPVTLAVDAGDDPRFASYRVQVTGAGGRMIFAQGGLRPNALEALMITFPAGFFSPGEYRLNVSGVAPGGDASPLGSHPFRVVAKH
jgi:hypothetical protein